MLMRLPWTLWGQIFAELWKLVLLTTAVLVAVIAFAAAVKPLADGKLNPIDTFKFMMLAVVPMLQYSLPFAACFGATLAYHRISSENELTAAYAGGISHRAILVPAVVSGIVLSLMLLVLSHLVIPRMLRHMAELVTANAARYIQTQIERGQPIVFGYTLVYADQVRPAKVADGFSDGLWLGGLLVVSLNEAGEIVSHGSASSASVWIRPAGAGAGTGGRAGSGGGVRKASSARSAGEADLRLTEVIIQPTDAVVNSNGMLGTAAGMSRSFFLPNSFRDNPKFLSFTELRQLLKTPEKLNYIDRSRTELALRIAEREALERVRRQLRDQGVLELRGPFKDRVVIKAGGTRPVRTDGKLNLQVLEIIPLRKDQPVIVERVVEGKVQIQRAGSALISVRERTDGDAGTAFTVTLRDVAAERVNPEGELLLNADEADGGVGGEGEVDRPGEARERPINDVSFEDDPARELMKMTWGDLTKRAGERADSKPIEREILMPAADDLTQKVSDLFREVMSKEHERYAQCLACFVMVMVGSTMAMRLRDALPLTIYLWAFFPALLTVLAISGGQQLTHGQGAIGLTVLYAGVAALGVLAGVEFFRLSRH